MIASVTTETGSSKPRIEGDREVEILNGVIDTVIEVGYDRLTFDAVASKVRASKATLYRKWPTKAELVVSALDHLKAQGGHGGMRDTGSLAGDLTSQYCDDQDYNEKLMQIFGAIASVIHRDPELTTVFTERFMKPRMAELREVIVRAQQRGEVGSDADVDQLAAILPASISYHVLSTGECPGESFVRNAIEQVMLPACRASVEGTAHGGHKGQK